MDSIDLELTENENEVNLKNQNQALLQSFQSTHEPEDAWKPSSLGIRCFSQKPEGQIFLTRRILDLCSTDGKRKIEIEYNYSKDFQNAKEFKSKGSSIQNCSFCDTVSLDFEPESTFFDLLMDVQIITVEPTNLKHLNKIEDSQPPELVSYTDTGQELEIDSDCEESRIYSSYNLRYSKQRPNLDDHEFYQPSEDQLKDDSEILNGNGQKLIIKTLIKNEVEKNNYKSLESLNMYENSKLNPDQANQSFLSNVRSNSSSSIISSLSDSGSYCQNFPSTGKCSLLNNSSTSDSRSSSRRSVYTTVEFYPPGENYVEMIDLSSDSTYSNEDFFNKNELKDLSNNENSQNIMESNNNSENDDIKMEKNLTQKITEETIQEKKNNILRLNEPKKTEKDECRVKKSENIKQIKNQKDKNPINKQKKKNFKTTKFEEINEAQKKEKKLVLERTIVTKEKEIKYENKNEIRITHNNYEKTEKRLEIENYESANGELKLIKNKNMKNILKKEEKEELEEDYSLDLLRNYNLILNVKKKLHSEIDRHSNFGKDMDLKENYKQFKMLKKNKQVKESAAETHEKKSEKKCSKALENAEKDDLNDPDLNFINRSVYNLALKDEEENTTYTSLFKPSNDCTYFPLFKLENDKIKIEQLNKQEIEYENMDQRNLAVFNNEAEWKTDYIENFPSESIENTFKDFVEPIQKTDQNENNVSIHEDLFELTPKHVCNEKNQQSYFESIIAKFNGNHKKDAPETHEKKSEKKCSKALENAEKDDLNDPDLNFINRSVYNLALKDELHESTTEKKSTNFFKKSSYSSLGIFQLFFKKKENNRQFLSITDSNSFNTHINFFSPSNDSVFFFSPNDNEQFILSQNSFINDHNFSSFINHFNLKDISSLNFFIQESFFRSSIPDKIFSYFSITNFDCLNLNDIQQSQFLHDLYCIQNLSIQKPLFDDFAVFFDIRNEYSKYFLLTSHKFEFINDVERSGQSFFYLDEEHRINVQPRCQSIFKNAFSFILISVGALTIFSKSFN